ncbi:TonB-dependent receptor [Maribellus maritimus]|uniref:TonB-dependent receptor n=1 Tax=Maribellus maritimus TaxID=2870838 RepID=UPI001EE9BF65|nr:TonB-dependent receptor [Maribellus maritimus]MCG6189686.1 TonB-dependent receptor [Maribellus maritimus]
MKVIYALCAFLFILVKFSVADDPEKKPKTDAMLFGDVKSEGEHIPFATITIKGTTIGAAADATGHFKMTNLPVGEQTVIISAIGYKTLEKRIKLEAKKSVTILAELTSDVIGLDQVVVSADRNEKSRRESPTIVNSINPKLFERTSNVTLSEGLNFAPGLRMENNCQNCGFSQVRMNGLEGPYSQILINSRPVFSGLAGVYGLELIPANMIERVEVIRGGGSAMYGSNAIAGTINLITKDPVVNNFSVSGNYSLTGAGTDGEIAGDANLNLNGSFISDDYKSGMSLFGFTRKRNPYDANGDGFSEIALIENLTLGTRIFHRISDRGKLTVDYFKINEYRRGGNKFDLPLHESDISESVTHDINTGAINFDLLMRETDKFSAFFSAQSVNRGSYYGANQDLSAYGETEDFTFSSGLQYNRKIDYLIFASASLTSGLEYNGSFLEDKKLGYYAPEEDTHYGNTLVADQKVVTQAGFLQSEWTLLKWVITAGIRYDHYTVSDVTKESDDITGDVLSPRVSLLYNIADNLQFRTGFAKGFRAPQIFDEDLHIETSGSRKVLHENATDLKQESSNSFTASFDYTNMFGNWQVQFLAEGFFTRLNDPFSNEYGTPDEDGVVVYTRVNAEDGATVKGFNLELNATPSEKLQIQSGFTIQRSSFDEPQEFDETRFFRSPDSYGYLSLNYNPLHEFSLAFTGNYSGSMLVPYFGPLAANPEIGQLNTSDSFFDAGIKLTYEIHLSDVMSLEIIGGAKNIFNSYQKDFDTGVDRDPAYIYGPMSPRTIYFGVNIGNFL